MCIFEIIRSVLLIFLTCSTSEALQQSFVCNIPINAIAKMADFVFSGKIESLVKDDVNPAKIAMVRIKRIIKSDEKYLKNVSSGITVSLKLSAAVFFDDFSEAKHRLENCSDKGVFSDVKIRDVKVFVVRLSDKINVNVESDEYRGYFPNELMGISLPLNLQILDEFSAIVEETKEMIGSYGIYCRRSGSGGGPPGMANCEDDGGFSQDDNKPNSGYYSERMVVVNSARNGTTTNTIVEPDTSGKVDEKFQWCCFNDTTGTEKIPSERNSHWYKSSVLLLLLAVVLAVVVLVSGLLLYFKYTNYVTYKPRELLTEGREKKKRKNNGTAWHGSFFGNYR